MAPAQGKESKEDDMDDFEKYDREVAERVKENNEMIALFQSCLEEKGLSPKTIRNHLGNMELYLNEYLQREEPHTFADGAAYPPLDDFFGCFYTRKCMWSTPSNIKTAAASIRKFYKCMYEHGKISKDAFQEVAETIKENMEDWQDCCADFNDGDIGSPFF